MLSPGTSISFTRVDVDPPCFMQQMMEDRAYRNEMDYEMYNHRANRRKSLERYMLRPETRTRHTDRQSTRTPTPYVHLHNVLSTCVCSPVVIHLCVLTCCYPPVCSDDYGDNRMMRTRSLSKISSSVARQQYVDTSDEEDYPRYPSMSQQTPYRRRNSRASSQENLGQAPPVRQEAFCGCNSRAWSDALYVLLLVDERAEQTHVCH